MEQFCKEKSGILQPRILLNKCEGKGPCVRECPYDVFEMQTLSNEEYQALNWIGKLKSWVHGRERAYVMNPSECHSCGICVKVCPENAIKLMKYTDDR